jgi:hypothetical protein
MGSLKAGYRISDWVKPSLYQRMTLIKDAAKIDGPNLYFEPSSASHLQQT